MRGIAPEATYRFKHALIRDAAYEALLKSRRKELHGQVARTIEEKFPVLKETHPEVVALHWAEAGETARAIAAWTRAGKAAQSHYAFVALCLQGSAAELRAGAGAAQPLTGLGRA